MRQYVLTAQEPQPIRAGFLADLNAEQRRVAEIPGGPLLVLAGAGTGKTRALAYRAAHLLARGVPPDRILLVTFTNRAAREMKDRVARLAPDTAPRLWAGTFHSVAARVLRQHADRLGYGTNFVILGTEETRDLMDATLAESVPDPTTRRLPKRDLLLTLLSQTVNTERTLSAILADDYPQFVSLTSTINDVFTAYLKHKVLMNAMDYDDLLVYWRLLLEDHEDLADAWSDRFLHILIDEFQDTNRLQCAIVDRLAGRHRNLTVVGDDCQSIYAFRGAEVRNILDFSQRYPDAQVVRLETNYRSTPQILEVANRSIRHNRRRLDKTLHAVREADEPPAFVVLTDTDQQAQFVAQRVLELRDRGVDLSRQAVLYRAHFQALELQIELQRRGIPYTVRSGPRFFEQAHIRDVLAHLRVLFNPLDRLAWQRVLRLHDGIGARIATQIYEALADSGDPWTALNQALEPHGAAARLSRPAKRGFTAARETLLELGGPHLTGAPAAQIEYIIRHGYETHLRRRTEQADAKIEDLRQLAHYASRFESYQDFLGELALVESIAAQDLAGGATRDEMLLLSTVHQAKGLEWEAVFLIGMADGQFPLRVALRSDESLEEERRLFYVAVTRAQRLLHCCFPQWGTSPERQRILLRPSRFLAELPHSDAALMETWRVSPS